MYRYKINGKLYEADIIEKGDGLVKLSLNGEIYTVEITENDNEQGVVSLPSINTQENHVTKQSDISTDDSLFSGRQSITAPLPGILLDIKVGVGDSVKKGDVVAVLDAMKMENNIVSVGAGVVSRVLRMKGDTLMEGDVIIEIE